MARWCNFQKQRPLVQWDQQLLRKAGSQFCNSRCEVAVGSGEEEGGRSGRAEMKKQTCSHGAGGGKGGTGCFWEKPPRGLSGLLSGLLANEKSRKQPMPGCAAEGKDLLPGHLAVLEPPLKKSHRQRKGRTKVGLTELSGCFHQPNGRVTAYFICLQLNPKANSNQNPKNQQKSSS